jgi:flagellar basal-body rod protein FlgF
VTTDGTAEIVREGLAVLSGLYSAATGINAAERNQEVIAQNLANLNRSGYRRSILTFEPFEKTLNAAQEEIDIRGGSLVSTQAIDFTPGEMEQTGRSLDVAIEGDGFLTVQGPTGTLLTRASSLYVGDDGNLILNNGFKVLGEQGPIEISPEVNSDAVLITKEGTVMYDGLEIGKLQAQTVADKSQLEPVGDAMFRAKPGTLEAATVQFHQGFRERSNVSATTELVRMIVGMRHHEAAQRALRSIETTLAQHTQDRGA